MPAQFPALQQRGLAKFIKLALDFSANETLDPRITFSRTSNATRTNAQGLIEYAPHNLLTYSENFDNAVWAKSNATVTANAIVAPDGTLTADKLEAATTTTTSVFQSITIAASSYTGSVYVKIGSGASDANRFYLRDNTAGTTLLQIAINYDTLAITYIVGSTGASVESVGNGWLRLSLTVTSGLTNGNTLRYGVCFVGNSETAGEFAYIWGAQLNIGSLQPYYTTSVKNLLGYSQNFENAAWAKSNASIDATPVMGPLGFFGAEKLVESAVAGQHFVNQGVTVINNSPYTLSCYMKAAERTYCSLEVSMGSSGFEAIVNLSEGTYTSSSYGSSSIPKAVVSNIGAGWYRLAIIGISISTTIATRIKLYQNAITQNYTGDGTSGIYIFGAQLSDSASLDPYSYNFGAAPTSTAYYGPRFDYDPVTLAPKGLLIEESRTNYIRNNTMVGAVVGTPGTLPTNYTYTGGGLVANVVGIGYEGGINYVDIQFVGTATSGSSGLRFEGSTGVTASTDQTWNTSLYIRKISGTTSGISSIGTNLTYLIAGAGSDAITKIIPFGTLDLASIAYNRQNVTLTAVTSGITAVRPQLILGHNIGANIDITLRIGMPQLEQGAFPTSVIPTTSAQVTCAADNASMVGTNFSSWYNQSEGTLFAEFDFDVYSPNRGIYSLNLASAPGNNRLDCRTSGFINTANGVGLNSPSIIFSSGVNKVASAYKVTNSAATKNGIIPTSYSLTTMPTVDRLLIGALDAQANQLNGHIKLFKFFSKRFINTYLQSLTQ